MTDREAMQNFICRGRSCRDCAILSPDDYYESPCYVLNKMELRPFANILKQNPKFLHKKKKKNPISWTQVRKYFLTATLK